MKLVAMPPGEGKTEALLEWLTTRVEGEIRVAVFGDHDRAMRALNDNPDIDTWRFVSVEELMYGTRLWGAIRDRNTIVLGVDDLDEIVRRMFPWPIKFATVSAPMSLTVELEEEL